MSSQENPATSTQIQEAESRITRPAKGWEICLCRQWYDPRRKYVTCSRCQALFHLECACMVGATSSIKLAFECSTCNPARSFTAGHRELRLRALPHFLPTPRRCGTGDRLRPFAKLAPISPPYQQPASPKAAKKVRVPATDAVDTGVVVRKRGRPRKCPVPTATPPPPLQAATPDVTPPPPPLPPPPATTVIASAHIESLVAPFMGGTLGSPAKLAFALALLRQKPAECSVESFVSQVQVDCECRRKIETMEKSLLAAEFEPAFTLNLLQKELVCEAIVSPCESADEQALMEPLSNTPPHLADSSDIADALFFKTTAHLFQDAPLTTRLSDAREQVVMKYATRLVEHVCKFFLRQRARDAWAEKPVELLCGAIHALTPHTERLARTMMDDDACRHAEGLFQCLATWGTAAAFVGPLAEHFVAQLRLANTAQRAVIVWLGRLAACGGGPFGVVVLEGLVRLVGGDGVGVGHALSGLTALFAHGGLARVLLADAVVRNRVEHVLENAVLRAATTHPLAARVLWMLLARLDAARGATSRTDFPGTS